MCVHTDKYFSYFCTLQTSDILVHKLQVLFPHNLQWHLESNFYSSLYEPQSIAMLVTCSVSLKAIHNDCWLNSEEALGSASEVKLCVYWHFVPQGQKCVAQTALFLYVNITPLVICTNTHSNAMAVFIYLNVTDRKADLEVWETVVEENVPAAEEELLLTDTQEAGHQRIQSLLWGGEEKCHTSGL